jgi:hypothetical protein
VRQLHLHLPKLPLATDNLQGNGSLGGEVRDQFGSILARPMLSTPISSSFLSIGTYRLVRMPDLTKPTA